MDDAWRYSRWASRASHTVPVASLVVPRAVPLCDRLRGITSDMLCALVNCGYIHMVYSTTGLDGYRLVASKAVHSNGILHLRVSPHRHPAAPPAVPTVVADREFDQKARMAPDLSESYTQNGIHGFCFANQSR